MRFISLVPIFVLSVIPRYASQTVWRRQAAAASASASISTLTTSTCGVDGNVDNICAPAAGATWQNGSFYQFLWFNRFPAYATTTLIDIWLFLYENGNNYPLYNFTQVNNYGQYTVQVTDAWFKNSHIPTLAPGSANQTWSARVFITTNNVVDPVTELNDPDSIFPKGNIFNLVQQAPPLVKSSSAAHSSTASSSADSTGHSSTTASSTLSISSSSAMLGVNNGKLAAWIIGVIVAACVVFVIACIALIWAVFAYRKHRQHGPVQLVDRESSITQTSHDHDPGAAMLGEKGEGEGKGKTYDEASVRSDGAMLGAAAGMYNNRSNNNNSLSNLSEKNSLAENGWTPLQGAHRPGPIPLTALSNPFADASEQDSIRRLAMSQELLRRELEAEGTQMHKVQRRTLSPLHIHEADNVE
ncbi:hypothetical protein BZG36_02703 [Bifiguratus adelaidae]|uniref:Mid2 domain-containing protein n=1 Tax=Bifiguratus adelaidae TaxID=1938954 RepID=A0A261Y1T0_9FUNG|nr:hypothetical protein BZG36_02703 [Bifiguratus adelaidae]